MMEKINTVYKKNELWNKYGTVKTLVKFDITKLVDTIEYMGKFNDIVKVATVNKKILFQYHYKEFEIKKVTLYAYYCNPRSFTKKGYLKGWINHYIQVYADVEFTNKQNYEIYLLDSSFKTENEALDEAKKTLKQVFEYDFFSTNKKNNFITFKEIAKKCNENKYNNVAIFKLKNELINKNIYSDLALNQALKLLENKKLIAKRVVNNSFDVLYLTKQGKEYLQKI